MILESVPGERYSRVQPLWKDQAVALLAGGPSLTAEQFEAVGRAREADAVRVIAINDSYLRAPWADVHYAADAKWHKWHTQGVDKPALGLKAAEVRERWASFAGQKCALQGAGEQSGVHMLRNAAYPYNLPSKISDDPSSLFPGKHGGFQALNIATLSGATKILLLGYDARLGANGERHWHGDHPQENETNAKYADFRRSFSLVENDLIKRGIKVINCSQTSAIETFPKMTIEEALA